LSSVDFEDGAYFLNFQCINLSVYQITLILYSVRRRKLLKRPAYKTGSTVGYTAMLQNRVEHHQHLFAKIGQQKTLA